jgi:hypothetical protein
VAEDKNMNPPYSVSMHFCDYLPFEDDLALSLNEREFPFLMDYLHQV